MNTSISLKMLAFCLLALLLATTSLAWAQQPTLSMPPGTSPAVINAFNDGSRAMQSGRLPEAVDKFKIVIAAIPQFGPAHTGCAVALAKMGRNSEALAEFEKAHSIMPDDGHTLEMLAQSYQLVGRSDDALRCFKQYLERNPNGANEGLTLFQVAQMEGLAGRKEEAVKYYKQYLAVYPNGQYAQTVRQNLAVMQREMGNAAGGLSSQGQDNYLNDVITQSRNQYQGLPAPPKWAQMPINVFIAPGNGVDGYRPEFQSILADAFNTWANASRGLVSIRFLKDPVGAAILCKFSASANDVATPAEGGQALTHVAISVNNGVRSQQGVIKLANVVILTRNLQDPGRTLTDSAVRWTCLHEAGHALGLAGHSTQVGDVMFFAANGDMPNSAGLSERDQKTIYMLYSR